MRFTILKAISPTSSKPRKMSSKRKGREEKEREKEERAPVPPATSMISMP
jgi:hypothetical protein